jgi:hypothetical protein
MVELGRTKERLIALFILGALLFTPPLLIVFNRTTLTFGVPTLYLYLFAAWAGLIIILALTIERVRRADDFAAVGSERNGDERRQVSGGPSDA